MIPLTNKQRMDNASDRIERASETIERAAKLIASLNEKKRTCKKCKREKDIDDFPYVVVYYTMKSGEMRVHKCRRHTCFVCYRKQTTAAKKKRPKLEFNYLF